MDTLRDSEYLLFFMPEWGESTTDTVIFADGFKRIPNKRKDSGEWQRGHSLLFNILTVEMSVDTVTVKSIGISLLPLHAIDIGVCQGYYQLPIYKEPFTFEMIDLFKNVEPWGLVRGINHIKEHIKASNMSLLVRLYLDNFEGWLDNCKFNFDLMNSILMPDYMPRSRVCITKNFFDENLLNHPKLEKLFKKKDFDATEIRQAIRHYMEKTRREGFDRLGININAIQNLLLPLQNKDQKQKPEEPKEGPLQNVPTEKSVVAISPTPKDNVGASPANKLPSSFKRMTSNVSESPQLMKKVTINDNLK